MPGLDSEAIRHAILTAQGKGYRQVRVRLGEDRFSAVLAPTTVNEPDEDDEAEALVEMPLANNEKAVKAPAVGYFRAVVDLKVGEKVAEGDKIGEIVALGLANDITADGSGEIAEVCVSDGDAVEYGQKVLILRP